jgi:DNA-binding NtrC family response regulator
MADLADNGRARVLVVDDEPVVADVLRDVLGKDGHEVVVAPDGSTGRSLLGRARWDVLLLDVMLPDVDGLEMLSWVREHDPDLAVVVITAFGTVEHAVLAMKSGAFHYVTKPFRNDEVRHLVGRAIQTTRLHLENKHLRRALEGRNRFERIVGRSRPMQEIYRFIEQVAPSRSTVLIQGESGTGKELVAHAIHKRSPRSRKPFLVVNSGSIPADLLEDNLFGHERGAFTGATSDKIGLVEAADGGTILFDEITTVAPAVQAKLLRVIQEKEFLPLGSVAPRTADVRILAATNEEVRKLVESGAFREDLYYRLNVLSVSLPPLRARLEDLPLLVAHFLERCNADNGKAVSSVAPEALERMTGYDWPGNVRELENVVERGVVLTRGNEIGVDVLPPELQTRLGPPAPAPPDGLPFYDAVARYERQLIESALRRCGGVQKHAAGLLGLKPTTLNEMIKRLRIPV